MIENDLLPSPQGAKDRNDILVILPYDELDEHCKNNACSDVTNITASVMYSEICFITVVNISGCEKTKIILSHSKGQLPRNYKLTSTRQHLIYYIINLAMTRAQQTTSFAILFVSVSHPLFFSPPLKTPSHNPSSFANQFMEI